MKAVRARAAIDNDDRINSQIEQIHRDFHDAHVCINTDDRYLSDVVSLEAFSQLIGHTGKSSLVKHVVRSGKSVQLPHEVRFCFRLTGMPLEKSSIG